DRLGRRPAALRPPGRDAAAGLEAPRLARLDADEGVAGPLLAADDGLEEEPEPLAGAPAAGELRVGRHGGIGIEEDLAADRHQGAGGGEPDEFVEIRADHRGDPMDAHFTGTREMSNARAGLSIGRPRRAPGS